MSAVLRSSRERLLLLLASIGLVLLVAAAGGATLRTVFISRARVAALYANAQAQAVDAEHLLATSERVARFVRTLLLAPTSSQAAELAAARRDYWATLGRMRARMQGREALFTRMERDTVDVERSADALIAARERGLTGSALQQRYERELVPRRARLEASTGALRQALGEALEAERHAAERLLDRSARLFVLGLVGGLSALLALLLLLVRTADARRLALLDARRREQALRLSEARFSGIVQIASDAIISVDGEQRITIFNRGAELIFGYRAEQLLGRPLHLLLPERHREAHAAHVRAFTREALTARRMGERREVCGLRSNGEEFPAEAAISRLQVDGTLLMTVVLRDVTEQRRTEREQRFLAAAGAELGRSLDPRVTLDRLVHLAVPELADCCLVCLDEGGAARLAATAHRDPSQDGWLREQQRLHPLEACLGLSRILHAGTPELHPTLTPPAAPADAGGGGEGRGSAARDLLAELRARSAALMPLRVQGRVIGVLALLQVEAAARHFDERDLATARELARRAAMAIGNARLYAEAQQATRARDEVLGIVAHDLRNPLNTLTVSARLLEQKLARQPPPAASGPLQSVGMILRSARRMDRLIQDLLDVVRLEAGTLAVSRSQQPAAALLEEAVGAMRGLAGEARVELALDVRGEPGEVRVDGDRILQVLGNLLGNALKFTPPGGHVTVGCAPREGELLCWVADTGPGIPAEQMAHLFDRYWQARPADRRGAGLGLSIAKGLVEAHGGRIWAESTPGAGSCFFFTLPQEPAAARELGPAAGA